MQIIFLLKRKEKQVLVLSFAFLLLQPFISMAQPVGANMTNPVVIATYTGGSYSYSDTKNNSTSNGYLNDYGQASDDIFYRFTVLGSTTITISHCGSGFDTYMHLLDGSGTLIAYNDDYGPACSATTASISTTLAAGTYYIVSEGYYTYTGNITTSVSLVVQAPATPPDTRNFIKTWDATAPETNPNNLITKPLVDVKHSASYFDGLGRPEQTVVKKGSLSASGNTDLVSTSVYDEYGREVAKYLPYVSSSSDGLFKTNPVGEQYAFYSGTSSPVAGQGEAYFYGYNYFEASPLNRIIKTVAAGNSWLGGYRGIGQEYLVNTLSDAVRIWTVTDVSNNFGTYSTPSTNGTYPAGELYKNITSDENQQRVIEYKDKEGKIILKKVQFVNYPGEDHTGWLCTYYIYDDLNQLRAVIQPKAVEALASASWQVSTDMLNELTFRYEYDARGRMIRKKVPGAGEVYMVYDARDRMVMSQDANLRASQKWMVTVYENSLNRPIQTGLLNDNGTLSAHSAAAYNSTSYPSTASGFELLTETHYDDYTGLPSGLSSSFNASGYGTYLNASTASPEYAAATPSSPSTFTKGAVTWTRTKVLGSASQYNSSVNLYDDKGRVIQAQNINVTTGLDVVTNQYSFSNQVLRSHIKHQKLGGTTQNYDVATKNIYDDLGRATGIEKNLNNSGWKAISSLAYDVLGQLKTQKLAPAFNSNAGLETLTYDYNIRGWMLGANRDYAKSTSSTANYFGFDLGYDKTTIASIGSYATAPQYNGNIIGSVWKSKGDGEVRKYDFTYDFANRLTGADFNQYTSGFNKTAGIDFSVSNLSYDANGNIGSMTQKGWKLAGSTIIDQLTYGYLASSNKLNVVTDPTYNDYTSKLGDFKYDPSTKGTTDYGYDVNGNLISDQNKKISSISYNHLNLPQTITVTGKGSIEYVYDAGGNKLKKIVHENGQADKTTLYLFGTYENDVLQFLPQEEGRVRLRTSDNSFQWDYFLKDHLGNVRMVLTEEQKTDAYPAATMETASAPTEEPLYSKLSETRTDKPSGYPYDGYLDPHYKVAKVRGDGQKIGPGIVLKVMAGDKINLRVSSYWNSGVSPGSTANPLTDLIAVLSGGISPIAGGKASQSELQNSSVFSGEAQSFLNSRSYNSARPKAYVHWLFFDEQFKYVGTNSSFEQVGNSGSLTTHTRSNLPVDKNGYVYVYVSNETTNLDVFFDNLQVTQIHGPILEETHYYPFGLTMAGISSKAANTTENKYKYNGIELENDLEIQTYDAFFRELDPQTGRWWQIDPVTDGYENMSPYASMYDNPMKYSDPLGDEGEACCGGVWDAVVSGVTWINNNLNPTVPIAELITGKSLNSGFTESKPRGESALQAATFVVPTAKAEAIIANEVKNVVVGQIEKQAVKTAEKQIVAATEKKAVVAAEKKAAGSTDFVVTEKGTAIPVPNAAKGPSAPNKGSGMSYQGGSGGKGMDKKVTGVRIMDANQNQGRRVNYMNKNGQTVDPKSGKTISKKDPRGHIPID
jgi:RHS repeat-associated protein